MRLTLFFTFNTSLKTWNDSGLLQREIRIYQELIRLYGIQVEFITYGDSLDREYEGNIGGIRLVPIYEHIRHYDNKLISILQSFFIPILLRKKLNQSDLYKTNQMYGSWVAVFSKWIFRKPLLIRCGYEFYDFSVKMQRSRFYKFWAYSISSLAYSNADLIHIATSSDEDIVENTFHIDKKLVNIRPNWIDTEVFRPFNKQNKQSRILFVGRLNIQKNLSLLLQALSGTNIGIDVVGTGELHDELKSEALNLSIDINFLGYLANDLMPKIYNQYAVYVICSHYEGNPKTLLEAMACGSAVIGVRSPGIREIIEDKINGILVAENSVELRNTIQELIINKTLQKDIGQQARKYIIGGYSLESAVNKEYISYCELLEGLSDTL